jgi:hypothetical protein
MNTRKLQLLLLGGLLASFAVWALSSAKMGDNDERNFHRMVRESEWGYRLYSVENWLPGPLVRLCRIASLRQALLDSSHANEQALSASGYLATAYFTVTNFPASAASDQLRVAEALRRFRLGVQVDLWGIGVQSNQLMIICPRKNVALIRTAIERP